MLPFKVCLLSLAVAVAALVPVGATPTAGDAGLAGLSRRMDLDAQILAERDLAVSAPELARRETRRETAERIRLAKIRAARSMKLAERATPECFPQGVTVAPPFGTYRNSALGCKLVCFSSKGYRVSGNTCIPDTPNSRTPCDGGDITNADGLIIGTHRLTAAGVCKLVCYHSTGASVSGTTCVQRVDVASDPTSCGPTNQVCLAGYPSGPAACVAGSCTITCPAGETPTPIPGSSQLTCA